MLPVAIPVYLCGDCCLRPDLGAGRYDPCLYVAPERDQQLARHCHNGDSPCAPGQRADALAEPLCQLAVRLVAKPEPCELPSSTIRARNARCPLLSFAGAPGAGTLIRPSGPCSLNRITQSRSVCRSIPPTLAASARDAPSSTAAIARSRRT